MHRLLLFTLTYTWPWAKNTLVSSHVILTPAPSGDVIIITQSHSGRDCGSERLNTTQTLIPAARLSCTARVCRPPSAFLGTPRTLCAVPRHPLPVFLEAPPSCLLPAILPPNFRFPEPSLSAPDPANLTSPELHAACSTNPECRFSGPVLGFSRNPTLVLVILFNQFLQKRQDLLFLPPLYLPHIVVTPVSSSLLPVSSDSIARTPSFCSVKPPSVLLNSSRSDGTAEVPKADACCPAALKTEESGQVASRFSVPAHGDRIFSVEVSPQPLPLSSESALQLYPGTQNIWPLGAPRSLTLAQYRQKQASQEAAHSPGPPEAKALNQETHITNNNGEFSGALLVSGLWMAIKKAQ